MTDSRQKPPAAQPSRRRVPRSAATRKLAQTAAPSAGTNQVDGSAALPKAQVPIVQVVVRDSFTMPAGDYALIGALKKRCLKLGLAMKKSELLRAGLATLAQMPDRELLLVATGIENVKTGRPPGKGKKKRKNSKSRSEH